MGSIGPIELVLGFCLGLVLYVASLVWVYRDAERRGTAGALVVIMVAVIAWPLGLIVWWLIRPEGEA